MNSRFLNMPYGYPIDYKKQGHLEAHLYKVEVFFRDSEDNESGIHTITSMNKYEIHTNYQPKVTVDRDMSRNPSPRRNATILYFETFPNEEDFVRIFIQHKGSEYVYQMSLNMYLSKFDD